MVKLGFSFICFLCLTVVQFILKNNTGDKSLPGSLSRLPFVHFSPSGVSKGIKM